MTADKHMHKPKMETNKTQNIVFSYSRIVEIFSRRFQGKAVFISSLLSFSFIYSLCSILSVFVFSTVQERLTKQVAEAIEEALAPAGVAVVIEAA